jgi:hypothetical protein
MIDRKNIPHFRPGDVIRLKINDNFPNNGDGGECIIKFLKDSNRADNSNFPESGEYTAVVIEIIKNCSDNPKGIGWQIGKKLFIDNAYFKWYYDIVTVTKIKVYEEEML